MKSNNESIDVIERCNKEIVQNTSTYDPNDYYWLTNNQDLWHLRKIEADKAWDVTHGSTLTKIAVIDTWFDLSHPDLAGKFIVNYDPYDNTLFTGCGTDVHGTAVASFIAAKTNGGGALAGVGFNCQLIGYQSQAGFYLERAHHASFVMKADVLTSSSAPFNTKVSFSPSVIEQAVVKDILNNGTTIVWPAGNGFDSGAKPIDGHSMGPLSAFYDERVIVVSSTDQNDNHYFFATNSQAGPIKEITHSHYQEVDVCAPGYYINGAICSVGNSDPYYWACHGTSFSTPIVAGIAGLLKTINPCFTAADIQSIIKISTDPITDEYLYSGLVGTGRVNAKNSVKNALYYNALFDQQKNYTSSPKANYFNSSHAIYIGFSVIGNRPYGWVLIQPGVKFY